MIHTNEIPILEFDDSHTAMITPQALEGRQDTGIKYGVIGFNLESRERMAAEYPSRIIGTFEGCGFGPLNIYEIDFEGHKIILSQGIIGAPLAACEMEDLIALGCDHIIAVGSAGVLDKQIKRTGVIVPTTAVRDEGTSYHYVAPSRYIEHNPDVISKICNYLTEIGLPFTCGKTWTSDAIYRETPDLCAIRRAEGCLCVDMENAAFGAVAQFHGIKFGQILYGSDCLDGEIWDRRDWAVTDDIKKNSKYELLKLAMRLVTRI